MSKHFPLKIRPHRRTPLPRNSIGVVLLREGILNRDADIGSGLGLGLGLGLVLSILRRIVQFPADPNCNYFFS